MPLTQEERLIRMMKGPLGADEIHLTSFAGHEAMSRLFNFQIEFVSTKMDLKPGEIVGKDLTIEIDRSDEDGNTLDPRFFHGYINRVFAGDVTVEETGVYKYRSYRAEMVPWFWFLTQTSRCFIFFPEKEDKSIYEIIEAVFDRAKNDLHIDPVVDLAGISDLKSRMVKHCVQYRETDFNFVSRIMERYGAFYYFKHEDGKHTLVVDMKKNYPTCEEAEVPFPSDTGTQIQMDHITSWQHNYEFVSGKFEHTDYNFETPSTDLKANAPKLPSIDLQQNEKYEVYDYPGEYGDKSEGKSDAEIRQEEEETAHNVVNATSLCKTFTPGHKFKLIEHPNEEVVSEHDNSYLITSIHHSASQPGPDSDEGYASSYSNSFTCIPDSVQYRPARSTPKPLVSGVQTAIVVGPEPIHTDKYGRVKVQFYWDREGKKDGNSSCWIRVSQNWGGKNWGGTFIPHVDQEVIVDFLEGDPDRPIITGRVYNADQMPPMELPANKTKSAITDHGGNQIIMEGDDGKQQMMLRSPHCETILTLGGERNPPEGVSLTTLGFGSFHVAETVEWETLSDYKAFVEGNKYQVVKGDYTTLTEGNSYNIRDGIYASIVAGLSYSQVRGLSVSQLFGANLTTTMAIKGELTYGHTYVANYAGKTDLNPAVDEQMLNEKTEVISALRSAIASISTKAGIEKKDVSEMFVKGALLKANIGNWLLNANKVEITAPAEVIGNVRVDGDAVFDENVEIKKNFTVKGANIKLL